MKKIALMIVLISGLVFAQSWQSQVSLYNVGSSDKISSVTNSSGIHILRHTSSGLTYSKVEPDGTTLIAQNLILSNSGIKTAKILEDDNLLCVVYRDNTSIKVMNSTNNGSSWNTLQSSRSVSNGDYMDVVMNGGIIKIVFDDTNPYSIYCYPQTDFMANFSQIGTATGTITAVSISEENGNLFTVYEELGLYYSSKTVSASSWNTPVSLSIHASKYNPNFIDFDMSQIKTDANGVHVFLRYADTGLNESKIKHMYKSNSSSSFNSPTSHELYDIYEKYYLVKQADDVINVFYRDASGTYKQYSVAGTNWSNESSYFPASDFIYESGSDIIAFKKTTSLTYRILDYSPATPENLSYTASASYHPIITWDKVKDADVKFGGTYKIYHKATISGSYSLRATIGGALNSFEDLNVNLPQPGGEAGNWDQYYQIKAVDANDNLSGSSETLTITAVGNPIEKSAEVVIANFELSANYPNPFNPTTTIQFSIPEESRVSLTIFNSLGEKIAELIKGEVIGSGIHSVKFNASELTSGLYLYKIEAQGSNGGSFSSTKKMLLIK